MQIVKKDFKLQLKNFISSKIVSNINNKNDNNKINEEIDQSDDPLEK